MFYSTTSTANRRKHTPRRECCGCRCVIDAEFFFFENSTNQNAIGEISIRFPPLPLRFSDSLIRIHLDRQMIWSGEKNFQHSKSTFSQSENIKSIRISNN